MRTSYRVIRGGFTLVELLVVIAIIGVLVALLLPAVQAAREAARRTQCTNGLRQIGLAIQLYADSHNKTYPPGRTGTTPDRDPAGDYSISWTFELLPYLEQQALYDSLDRNERVDSDLNSVAMRTPVATYYCPSRRSPAADRDFDNNDTISLPDKRGIAAGGDYAANSGRYSRYNPPVANLTVDFARDDWDGALSGPFLTSSKFRHSMITDGLSQTLAIGERHIPLAPKVNIPGYNHYNLGDTAFFPGSHPWVTFGGTFAGFPVHANDLDISKFGSEHPNLAQFVFLDGHVEALSYSMSLSVLQGLSTIGGEETVSSKQ